MSEIPTARAHVFRQKCKHPSVREAGFSFGSRQVDLAETNGRAGDLKKDVILHCNLHRYSTARQKPGCCSLNRPSRKKLRFSTSSKWTGGPMGTKKTTYLKLMAAQAAHSQR